MNKSIVFYIPLLLLTACAEVRMTMTNTGNLLVQCTTVMGKTATTSGTSMTHTTNEDLSISASGGDGTYSIECVRQDPTDPTPIYVSIDIGGRTVASGGGNSEEISATYIQSSTYSR